MDVSTGMGTVGYCLYPRRAPVLFNSGWMVGYEEKQDDIDVNAIAIPTMF